MPASKLRSRGAGHRAEFEQLVLPVLPVLHRTARRLAHPPADASDLVQETCLRAYRTFANFERGTNVKAWLFTILYSVAVNVADKERHRPEVQVDDVDERFANATHRRDDAELALLRQFDGSPHVDNALVQLPEEFRSAVVLVDLEELTYEEAASALGCPVGTLRSRLFRGRKRLFLALMDYVPSRRVLTEGGYEGGGAMIYYGRPGPFDASVEDRIVSAVRRLLKRAS
jgi:RNA polymerase sigma-70 factor (ECF subfamily)